MANRFVVSIVFLLVMQVSAAEPWLAPGDSGIRSDLQLLADAGIITAPVTTWPISWASVADDVMQADSRELTGAVSEAYERIREMVGEAMTTGRADGRLAVSGASNPSKLSTFEDVPDNSGEVEAGIRWMGETFALRLEGQAVSNATDGKTYRADHSYAAFVWKNQMFAASTQDRWWGPGWEGSLILSNNARPIPALTMQRSTTEPFKTKWLSWIGPWSYQYIYGQMEHDRAVPNARFTAFRVNFRPIKSLEIALSRAAQWCGSGRPCSLGTYWDLVKGTNDNRTSQADIASEPGNQLAAIDLRWVPMGKRLPIALYTQWAAEDEAGNLPSRWIGMAGIEFWGESPFSFLPGRYRAHIELTDTAAEFYSDMPRFDYAYNHNIYLSGYRYRGRAIGHSMDNDGAMYSFGVVLDQGSGSYWTALIRKARLNYGGVEANSVSLGNDTLWNVELTRKWTSRIGGIYAGVGYDSYTSESNLDSGGRVFLQWRTGYSGN